MRIWIIYALCVILIGGLIGSLVMIDPGYMMISYGSVTIESTLWMGIFIVVVIVGVLLIVFVLTGLMFRSAGELSAWSKRRRVASGRQQTAEGLLAMAEGDWDRARRVLIASAPRAETPLVNYLNAARAAHELGDFAQRDEYLERAHESTPDSGVAVDITRAELQLAKGQWQQCLSTLQRLREDAPRHRHVLEMLQAVYVAMNDWEAMEALLPSLEKNHVLAAEELAHLERRVWLEKARRAAAGDEAEARVHEIWKQVPRTLRRDAEWALEFARFATSQDGVLAETVVRECLSRDWSDALVSEYGRIEGADVQRQLKVAERWLKDRPQDAALLLALGRLAMRNRQWEKAREYFEASLAQERSMEASAELGRLCAALGDHHAGVRYLQDALLQGPASLPVLPLPEVRPLAVTSGPERD